MLNKFIKYQTRIETLSVFVAFPINQLCCLVSVGVLVPGGKIAHLWLITVLVLTLPSLRGVRQLVVLPLAQLESCPHVTSF